jgi:MscS family membrane protein
MTKRGRWVLRLAALAGLVRQAAASAVDSLQPPVETLLQGGALAGGAVRQAWQISGGKLFAATLVFLVALLVIKYLSRALEVAAERWSGSRLLIKRITPILRIAGWVFAIYVIIVGIFAPPVQTLVAATASAGIAIGFASQDILKNVFGGIMILFDRPFQVGDKIQVGSHYGEVLQIGLRTVRIVTPDDSMVSLPNSEIVNQPVSNSNSGEFSCQVVSEFFLPPDIDLERVKELARRAAAVSRFVYIEKPIAVRVRNEIHQGRSLVKLRLKAYVFDLRYEFAFASDMTETLLRALREEGLAFGDLPRAA